MALLFFKLYQIYACCFFQDIAVDPSADETSGVCGEECDHFFIQKDDLGLVCRICGVVQQGIETMFEFLYSKVFMLFSSFVQLMSLYKVTHE